MFKNKEEYDALPYLDRNKAWLKTFAGCVTISAALEFISTSIYITIFALGSNFGTILILSFIFKAVLIVCGVIGVAWVVGAQRLAIRKLIGAWGTETILDDIFYSLGIIAITIALVYGGNQGDKLMFHSANSYEPNIEEYTQNKDYLEKKSRKESISNEKKIATERADKAVADCAECKVIEGNYQSKIRKVLNSKITRYKPSEANWAASKNAKIESQAKDIEAEMNGKIQSARGRVELKRDSIIQSLGSMFFSADTSIASHQIKIDSANKSEIGKRDERIISNNFFAGLLVVITQLLCFIGAGGQSFMYRKDGKIWHEIEGKLSASDITKPIITIVNVVVGKFAEWLRLWVSNFMANQFNAVTEMKEKAFQKNELARVMYESGAKSLKEAEYFINKSQGINGNEPIENSPIQEESFNNSAINEDEKKNEIISENDENMAENDGTLSDKGTDLEVIERLIEGLYGLMSISDNEQIPIINNLIKGLEQLKTLY